MTVMVNRRERVRAATVQEIKEVARRQLINEGPNAVSLRAIAREMGMTAPALYRYFPSFDHLVAALVNDLYGEICAAMDENRVLVADDPGVQLLTACRTFRAWAVRHQAEFGLIFSNGKPESQSKPGVTRKPVIDTGAASRRVGAIFLDSLSALWQQRQFPVPAPDNLEPAFVRQLTEYRESAQTSLPLGPLAVAVSIWTRVYGLVSLEVFGHIQFATDGEAFFEQQIAELADSLQIVDQPRNSPA